MRGQRSKGPPRGSIGRALDPAMRGQRSKSPPRGSIGRALDSGSENPGSSRSGARYSTPGGDGRRSVAGTARGPDEAGEWGGPCPVVGAR